ncbi:MAG: hypothetical protein MUO85_06000 [candidate division Zixibacteria bacterium]|nr:hypothetical protein [candidate division Zixibacteria bacterium]
MRFSGRSIVLTFFLSFMLVLFLCSLTYGVVEISSSFFPAANGKTCVTPVLSTVLIDKVFFFPDPPIEDFITFSIYNIDTGDTILVFDGPADNSIHQGFAVDIRKSGVPGIVLDHLWFTVFWDNSNPHAQLAEGNYSFKFECPMYGELYKDSVGFKVVDTTWTLPSDSLAITITPYIKGTGSDSVTNAKPLFENFFKPISYCSFDTNSLKFIFYKASDDSIIVYDYSRDPKLLSGFEGGFYAGLLTIDWDSYPTLSTGKYNFRVSADWLVPGGLVTVQASRFHTLMMITQGPELSLPEYTNSKGEFQLYVQSFGSQLDTSKVYLDLYSVIPASDTTSEQRFFLKTISPDNLKFDSDTIEVIPGLSLENGTALDIWVYNGTTADHQAYVNSATPYPDSLSCQDLVLNECELVLNRLSTDGLAPKITMLDSTDIAWKFHIYDGGSGVNNNSVVVKQNGEKVTSNAVVQYDPNTHVLTYYPLTLGALFVLEVADNVGNRSSYSTYVKSGKLIVYDVHSHPNPFNPVKGEEAKIIPSSNSPSNQDLEISAKVYDLAGKHVATLKQNAGGELLWNGRTDGGELVANGVYLCYVSIKDLNDLTVQNYLLKIAVVKKD